jgi:hypothetical protein
VGNSGNGFAVGNITGISKSGNIITINYALGNLRYEKAVATVHIKLLEIF